MKNWGICRLSRMRVRQLLVRMSPMVRGRGLDGMGLLVRMLPVACMVPLDPMTRLVLPYMRHSTAKTPLVLAHMRLLAGEKRLLRMLPLARQSRLV